MKRAALGPWSPTFLAAGTAFMEDSFSGMVSGWFRRITLIVHFISLLLLQLHLRSSGVRSWRLGTPALGNGGMWRAESAGQIRVRKACVPGAPFRQILSFALCCLYVALLLPDTCLRASWKCGASWPNTNQPSSAAFWGKWLSSLGSSSGGGGTWDTRGRSHGGVGRPSGFTFHPHLVKREHGLYHKRCLTSSLRTFYYYYYYCRVYPG